MIRVLIVEDEIRLRKSLSNGLIEEGYVVVESEDGNEALSLAGPDSFDLLLLDVMLPGRDGFEVLSEIRAKGCQQPVLLLTARDDVKDRVRGLDLGADDYLVKPFAFEELLARLRALLRRGIRQDSLKTTVGLLSMDLLHRRAMMADHDLDLSPREFELLAYLAKFSNQTISRERLAADVWRDDQTLLTNVIDVFINRLRKKLDRSGGSTEIHTVRGEGYVLRAIDSGTVL